MIKTLLICLTLVMVSSAQAELFRYKDKNGKTVLNSSVPPEARQSGYEILNEQGRVIKVVERALNKDEIELRDAAIAEAKRKQEALAEQRKSDEALLAKYGTPKDLIRMRDRKLDELNTYLSLKKNTAKELAEKKYDLEKQAAGHERAGRTIPDNLKSQITQLGKRIVENDGSVDRYMQEKSLFIAQMTEILTRLEYLEKNPLK